MDRKQRLKITRTPEKGFVYADESLYIPTPQPRKFVKKEEEDVLPFKLQNNVSWKTTLKRYIIYIHIAIPYLFIAYKLFIRKEENLSNLGKEILKEKNESVRREKFQKKVYNVARIEFGTNVTVEEGLYKYGLYGFRTYNDPNTILNDNISPGDCLAIHKDSGLIKISFKCKLRLSKIGIFHPETDKQESALKDFEIIGPENRILGKFTYDLSKSRYQYFDFPPVQTDSFKIRILSNHGCQKYTTLYKLFVYGRVN